jgi:hypothetical protein
MIFKQIKEKLKSQDKPQLSKALGYNNQKNFEKTLEHFLNCSTLHEWLESGNYDFVNQTQEFFTKLAKELNIDEQLIKESLEKENSYIKETERFKDSYIFVNTNFRRTTQPIFILAFCESMSIPLSLDTLSGNKWTPVFSLNPFSLSFTLVSR